MQPLEPTAWPEALEDIKTFLGIPLNIHNIMAHHPELLSVWMPLRNHVVAASSLSPRQRELLILRTAHNCEADYEWRHHVSRGLLAGLTQMEIDRVKKAVSASDWRADEAALLNAADDCHRAYRISDITLLEVTRHFNPRQQLDIAVTVGMYMTLALIIKTFDVPMEHD